MLLRGSSSERVGDCISSMSTEAQKAALRADGWRFSGDPTAPSGPAEQQGAWVAENAVESAADVATRLKAAVCQRSVLWLACCQGARLTMVLSTCGMVSPSSSLVCAASLSHTLWKSIHCLLIVDVVVCSVIGVFLRSLRLAKL